MEVGHLDVSKKQRVDIIDEYRVDEGVLIETILIKDGEVNGRNVGVDGTKLDTIEVNATTDQTQSEIENLSISHSSLSNITVDSHHNEVHTIVSHDTNATGLELNTLTDGSNADAFHTHSSSGGGDMFKLVYDTDNDGVVDEAETLTDGAGTKTYAEISTEIDTDINNHNIDTSVHGVDEVADVATVSAEIDADIAAHVALPDPHIQYQKEAEKSVANGYASLDADAKIPEIEIPDVALTVIHKVNTEAAQFALDVERGDVCIRTDLIKTYFALNSDNIDIDDWEEVLSHSVKLTYEFGETLNPGEPVYITNAGTLKRVFSYLNDITNEYNGYYMHSCAINTSKIIVAYRNTDDSDYLTVICGDIQIDKSIIWGTAVRVIALPGLYIHVDKLSTDKFILTALGTTNYGSAWVGDVSGNVITMGAEHQFVNKTTHDITSCRIAENKFAVAYGEGNKGFCEVGSVTGTSISFGSAYTFGSSLSYENWVSSIGTDNKFAVFYRRSDSTLKGFVRGFEATGTTISDDSAEVECTFTHSTFMVAENIATDRCALIFRDNNDGYKGKIITVKFTGITPTANEIDMITFDDKITYYPSLTKLEDNVFVAVWCKYVSPYKGYLTKFTNTDTTLNKEANQIYAHGYAYYNSCCTLDSDTYFLTWWNTEGKYTVIEGDINNITSTVGIVDEYGTIGEFKDVDLLSGITNTLSGMHSGLIQYIQDDLSISEVLSEYPIGIAITSNQMLINKNPFGE